MKSLLLQRSNRLGRVVLQGRRELDIVFSRNGGWRTSVPNFVLYGAACEPDLCATFPDSVSVCPRVPRFISSCLSCGHVCMTQAQRDQVYSAISAMEMLCYEIFEDPTMLMCWLIELHVPITSGPQIRGKGWALKVFWVQHPKRERPCMCP